MSAALKFDSLSPNASKVLAWTAKGEALNALPMALPDLAKALQELSGRGLDEHGQSIVTVRTDAPVAHFAWQATRGDYDLGAKVGWGATEQAAIDDLLMLEDE